MLIEFTVGNYLSFKEKKTLSMEATAIKDNPGNVIDAGKYKLLRSVVLYGANSSGKSNFIKAMSKMWGMVMWSAKESSTSEIDLTPFLLSAETGGKPSYFEIVFLIGDIRYRYGFEADKKMIHSEWLFESKVKKEKPLFLRDKNVIEVTDDFEEGKGIEEKTRDNALFLSVVDQFNGIISKKIMKWLKNQIIFSGLQHEEMKGLTSKFLENKGLTTQIKDFLTPLNLGFHDFSLVELDENKNRIVTYHSKYDNKGKVIGKYEFDLLKQESSGTNKLYDMAGSLTCGLELGTLTVIDELDAKLHPLLTMAIVKLFNSPEHNKNNGQLVFATHDTNLLTHGGFRRDQIYFTEKNRLEATDMYSLVEYREPDGTKIRNDRSFEKDYIAGRYGAIPYIGDFSKLINDGKSSED
ncbi:MAG: ATP-binding protein [Bacteroidetes bacterium]|nr:ATP-binding protein [Bacteroidota bacterium]